MNNSSPLNIEQAKEKAQFIAEVLRETFGDKYVITQNDRDVYIFATKNSFISGTIIESAMNLGLTINGVTKRNRKVCIFGYVYGTDNP